MRSLALLVLLFAIVACAEAISLPPNLLALDRVSRNSSDAPTGPDTARDAPASEGSVPLYAPFSGFGVKQCVTGTAKYNILAKGYGRVGGVDGPDPVYGVGPPLFASDPANKQFMFYNAGGFQFTLANGTYTTAPNAVTGIVECFYDAKYTFDHEVLEHTSIVKLGTLLGFNRYFGRSLDVGSCDTSTAFTIFTGPLGVVRKLEFSQGYPVPSSGPPQGLTGTGVIEYGDNCPTSGAAFTARFTLPPICYGTLPTWCQSHRFD